MRPDNFDVEQIIESLQGTCSNTLATAIDQHYPGMLEEDLTERDNDIIDNTIFLCDNCGWWCETSEAHESNSGCDICDDCKSEEEGE